MKEHLTLDLEAEKKIIRDKVNQAFEVENRKDVEAIMELDYFAEDIIAHGPID